MAQRRQYRGGSDMRARGMQTVSVCLEPVDTPAVDALAVNALAVNALAVNALAVNALAVDAPAMDKPAVNALAVNALAVDAPSVRDSAYSGLMRDAIQLQLTNDIYQMLKSVAKSARAASEAKNIIERWLISMVNTDATSPLDYSIYRSLSPDDKVNRQLRTELIDKQLAQPSAVDTLLQRILSMVEAALSGRFAITNEEVVCEDGAISYTCQIEKLGERASSRLFTFTHAVDEATRRLLKHGSCGSVVHVALRYAALLSGGQQWGIPHAHVKYLYDHANVRNEAFASPFNSRLLGMPGASFCSLFLETDRIFGSIGDFFALDLATAPAGNWVVNPPFVDELLARAARKCLSAVESGSATFYFIMPAWRDCEAYRLLHESRFTLAEIALIPGHYYYESPEGERIRTRAESVYFAIVPMGAAGAESKRRAHYHSVLEHFTSLRDE